MKAHIIKIGNSKGIRIPKTLLEQSRISEEVDLQVEGNQILIRPASQPREGWEQAFRLMAERKEDRLFDITTAASPQWDKEEWQW